MRNRKSCSAWTVDDICASKYLEQVTDILAQYAWVYETRNTNILSQSVLQKIPQEWYDELSVLSEEELHQILFDFVKESWPSSLKQFIEQCQYLGHFRFPSRNLEDFKETLPKYSASKVSFKKKYEIEIMSSLVNEVCQDLGCAIVLDIGSGLGYLDQILHHCYGLQCIGLDASSKYTLSAVDRLKKDPCTNSIKHRTLEIKYTKKCTEDLKSILYEANFNCNCNIKRYSGTVPSSGSPVIMVGLHSCGNLTQDMMKLFTELDEMKAFVCVGCCYNKIDLDDFPMSTAVQSVVSSTVARFPEWTPSISGLRLAAHGTRPRHRDKGKQEHLEKNMFFRALFQKYIEEENITWQQPKRHIRPANLLSFEIYCKTMFKNHLLEQDIKTIQHLNELHKKNEYLFPRIRILLVLQALLQPLWEGFVVVDRMLFFREKNIRTEVLAMWDDAVSSRNLALCAYKR